MKCLRKYKWVKLPRMHLPGGKGLMGYWAKLASRAAFRYGEKQIVSAIMCISGMSLFGNTVQYHIHQR